MNAKTTKKSAKSNPAPAVTEGTTWTLAQMAEFFQLSETTIRRKVLAGDLPEPDIGDILEHGAKRWIVQNVINFLTLRQKIKNSKERIV